MNTPEFQSKTPREELDMILADKGDFILLKQYLDPLITRAVTKQKFGFTNEIMNRLREEIVGDIPVAVEKYLANKNPIDKDVSFSAYFTWYIGQRINAELNKRSLWEKIRAALKGS